MNCNPIKINTSSNPDVIINAGLKAVGDMIKDNFMTLCLYLVIVILLGLMAIYFIFNMIKKIQRWKVGVANYKVDDTKEDYPTNPKKYMEEPIYYYEDGKQKFVKEMKSAYNDYNKEKTQYIRKAFNKENDDAVNEEVLFRKYDDYVKPENE